MHKIVDMHCHILPGVDDGPETMEETMALLREAERQGVTCMIATPHFHPGRYKVDSHTVLSVLEEVRQCCRENDIDLTLLPGQECYWYSGLLDALERGEALTMNGTRYVLVEFEPDTIYSVIRNAVRSLSYRGYGVIVAHFERYACLFGRPERLEELREFGALLQMNYDRLLDKDTLFHKNPWRQLLLDNRVDFLGSDTHGMAFRPLHIQRAVEWLEKNAEGSLVLALMETNPNRLLEGK